METLETFNVELTDISNKIAVIVTSDDNPQSIREALYSLAQYKARVNYLMPLVQKQHDFMLGIATDKVLKDFGEKLKGNSSFVKNYIQSEMTEERYTLNMCERISSTIERYSENLRTCLSSLKEELRNLPT